MSITEADVTEEDSDTAVAPSGSGQEDSNASNDSSSVTREIAYLMYGSVGGGEQAEPKEFANHYFKSKFAHGGVMKPIRRKNVLVECGSTQCEFEIKAYQIEKSSYVSHRQSPSPQVASQGEHHRRTPEVEQGAEQSLRAPVQSWPQCSRLEENPSQGQPAPHYGSAPPGTPV